MLPCRPCSRRLRSRVPTSSSLVTSGSEPGPFGLRWSGGTGGSLLIVSSLIFLKLPASAVVPSEHVAPLCGNSDFVKTPRKLVQRRAHFRTLHGLAVSRHHRFRRQRRQSLHRLPRAVPVGGEIHRRSVHFGSLG